MIQSLLYAAGAARPFRSTPPASSLLEALEARRLLALVTWDGGGDGRSWQDPLNWSADILPTGEDDARIDQGHGEIIFGRATGGFGSVNDIHAVRSFLSARPVRFESGSLAALGDMTFSAGFSLTQDTRLSSASGAIRMSGSPDAILSIAGDIRASSIVLDAGSSAVLVITGHLDASSATTSGGSIDAFGRRVVIDGSAFLNASGPLGGGSIRIGGDYMGQGPAPTAEVTYIGQDTRITADATSIGHGGRVIVWSDTVTGFYGKISVRGSGQGKSGGFVETSGKEALDSTGFVDAASPLGPAGSWLLDPRNVTISASITAGGAFSGGNPNTFTPTADNANVLVSTVNSALIAGTAVTITTGATGTQAGSITLNAAISASTSAPGTLTLRAAGDININANISMAGTFTPTLNLFANDSTPGPDPSPAVGSVFVSAGVTINLSGGTLNVTGVNFTNQSSSLITTGNLIATMTGDIQLNGDITANSPTTGLSLQAGSDGTGSLSFGATGVDLNASTIVLRAGDGSGGSGTATVNVITNNPTFRGSAGGATRPTSFTIQQDASITDANLPAAARFAAAISNLNYVIRSDDGSVTISTTSKFTGTDLDLIAAVNVNVNAALGSGTSLLVVADVDTSGGGVATLNASINVSLIQMQAATIVVTGGTNSTSTNGIILFATGAVTLAGSLHAIEIIFYVEGASIALSGDISANGGIQLTANAGNITQTAGGVSADRLLVGATGSISMGFANEVAFFAGNATGGDLTYSNTDQMLVTQVTVVDTFAGVSSTGITTLNITGAVGVITINRPVSAETRVVLSAPGGAATSAPGIINSIALLLQGGGGSAAYTLSTNIQSLASNANANLAITDANALFVTTIAGVVGITSSGRDVFLTSGGSSGITLNSGINLGDGRIQLNSPGAVTQLAGANIIAGSLVLVGAGSFTLSNSGNNVVNLVAAAGAGALNYFDADGLFISSVFGVNGINNRIGGVTIIAGGSLTISNDVISSSNPVLLQSGFNGLGNLTFGAAGVDINAPGISLVAGNGSGGATTAVADLITNSPTFRGGGGGATNPTSFLFRQDAAITDAVTPVAGRFGAATFNNLNYTLQSGDNSVTISTASRVVSSNLVLFSRSGSFINVPLSLASLAANNQTTLTAATLTASGNIVFNGDLILSVNTTITGGSVTFGGTITDGAPRVLNVNSSGVTAFFGAVDIGSLVTNAGGSTSISANMTTEGPMTFNDAVSLASDATLTVTLAQLTFSSTLAAGGSNLTILVDEIAFLGGANSVTGSSQLRLAPAQPASAITVFSAVDVANVLDLSNADIAALSNGFSLIRIGRNDTSGLITIRGGAFNDPVEFLSPAGSIATTNAILTGSGNASFTFNSPSTNLATGVRTSGQPISFLGAAVINAASLGIDSTNAGATPAGANVTFSGPVNAQSAGVPFLTVSVGTSGIAGFNSAVGAIVTLLNFTVSGRAAFAGGSVTTTGAQTYTGDVALQSVAVTTFTGTVMTFNARLDSQAAGQSGATIAGTGNFLGSIGTIGTLRFLTVNGAASFTGSINTSNSAGGTGDVTVSGLTTLAGPNDSNITFTTTGGALRFNAAFTPAAAGEQGLIVNGNLFAPGLSAAATPLRQIQVSGATTITAAGSIRTTSAGGGTGDQTYTGAVTLQGAVIVDALGGAITFGSTAAAAGNALTIRAAGFSAAGNITGTGAFTIEPSVASGNMLLGGTDGPGGALDLSSATLTRFTNGFSSITFGRADGSGTLTIASAYNVFDPTIFRAPVAPGRIIVNAPLSGAPGSDGGFTFIGSGATTILNADVRTPGRPIVFNDAVLIGVPLVTIDSTNNGANPGGADISFLFALGSEVGENNSVIINGGTTGATLFTGPVGVATGTALGALTTDAGGLTRVLASITAATQTFGDSLRLEADATFTGNQITLGGAFNALGAGIDASFANLGPAGALLINAPVGQTAAPASFITSPLVTTTINTAAITASGQATFGGPVILGTTTVVTAPSIAFNSGITGSGNSLTANGSGITTFGGTTSGLVNLITDAPGQTFIAGPALFATGNIIFGDAVQILAPTTISTLTNLVFGSTLSGQEHNFTLQGAEINFLGAVSGTGVLRLLQASPTQNYNVAHSTEGGGDALDITAAELNLFAGDFALVEFGTEDGAGTMSVQPFIFDTSIQINMPGAGGQISIEGTIAVASDNGNIGIRGNGSTTHLYGNLVTNGGAITINDSVILEVPGVTLDSTNVGLRPGGPIFVQHRINSATNLPAALFIRAGSSTAQLDGPLGNLAGGQLASLIVQAAGGTHLNSTLVRTIGQQTYTGEVILGPNVTLQTTGAPITFNDPVSGQSNLIIAPGTGAVTFGGSVGGTTTLASLTINSGSTRIFSGAVNVGVLTVFGGTVAFNGLTNINTGLLIAGTLGGTGTINFDLPLTWVGGDMVGPGTTVIRQSAALVISGGTPKTLSRRIENNGATYWTDGSLTFAGASFVNLPTGQFFAQSTGSFLGTTGVNSFDNQGFFERSGPNPGAASLTNLLISNSGQIALAQGDLNLTPAGPGNTVFSPGSLSLGSSTLNITGNLALTSTSQVSTTLVSPEIFGRIAATGSAAIDGTLIVALQAPFIPAIGQAFQVVTANVPTGTFAQTILPTVPARRASVQYNPGDVTVVFTSNADFNGDGFVNPDDLADFITAFFLDIQFPGLFPEADFNGDGFRNPDDLADFITAFFGGG